LTVIEGLGITLYQMGGEGRVEVNGSSKETPRGIMRRAWKMKRLVGFLVMAAMVLTTACVVAAESGAQKVRFGLLIPLTGPAAAWGIATERITQMMADDINAAGGFTVQGKKCVWEVVSYDTKYDGSKAATEAQKLVYDDQVKFSVLFGGGVIGALQGITEPNKVFGMALAWGRKHYCSENNFYTFSFGTEMYFQQLSYYPWVKEHYGVKTLSQLNPNDELGKEAAKEAGIAAQMAGLKVVRSDYFERATQDFYPVLGRLLADKPDLLDCGGSPPQTFALMVKQARELGYEGVIAGYAVDNSVLVDIAGKYADGTHMVGWGKPSSQVQEIMKRYKERYGEWNDYARSVYEVLPIVTGAIEKADNLDPTEVARVLADPTYRFDSPEYGKGCYFGDSKRLGIRRGMVPGQVAIGIIEHGKSVEVDRMGTPVDLID